MPDLTAVDAVKDEAQVDAGGATHMAKRRITPRVVYSHCGRVIPVPIQGVAELPLVTRGSSSSLGLTSGVTEWGPYCTAGFTLLAFDSRRLRSVESLSHDQPGKTR